MTEDEAYEAGYKFADSFTGIGGDLYCGQESELLHFGLEISGELEMSCLADEEVSRLGALDYTNINPNKLCHKCIFKLPRLLGKNLVHADKNKN